MKVTELLRGLLDLIDGVDTQQEPQVTDYEDEVIEPEQAKIQHLSNSPDEIYTSLEIIDTMGNDVNGPVTPEQVKTATFPMFFGMTNG
jgi:2,3-bisphosphoglycerate-independent phosphoglycerate mutase